MKFNLEQYLYPIDQSFANKSPRDIMMIYIIVAVGLVAFSYALFWDDAEAEYKKVHDERVKIEKKLTDDERYLQQHPETEIAKIEKEIEQIKLQTVAVQKKNEYINYKISQISELFYNEKAWGSYLDSISENAKKYHIKLSLLSNRKAKDKEKFGHVLDIQIQGSGKYRNIVHFINAMEQSKLVIDLHKLNLEAKKSLTFDINSSVWGITY